MTLLLKLTPKEKDEKSMMALAKHAVNDFLPYNLTENMLSIEGGCTLGSYEIRLERSNESAQPAATPSSDSQPTNSVSPTAE